LDHNIVFWDKRNFFAENWLESRKIMIITLTLGLPGDPRLLHLPVPGVGRLLPLPVVPGIDFTKLHFGRKKNSDKFWSSNFGHVSTLQHLM
jgi:hypothetical protein